MIRVKPHPYGHAVHVVEDRVLRDRDGTLEMELGPGEIWAPCAHNVGGPCDDSIDTSRHRERYSGTPSEMSSPRMTSTGTARGAYFRSRASCAAVPAAWPMA